MCLDWFSAKPNLAQLPRVEYIVAAADAYWSIDDFVEHYIRSRGVERNEYNQNKLRNAIQQFPGDRPPPRGDLEDYLDKRYGRKK